MGGLNFQRDDFLGKRNVFLNEPGIDEKISSCIMKALSKGPEELEKITENSGLQEEEIKKLICGTETLFSEVAYLLLKIRDSVPFCQFIDVLIFLHYSQFKSDSSEEKLNEKEMWDGFEELWKDDSVHIIMRQS